MCFHSNEISKLEFHVSRRPVWAISYFYAFPLPRYGKIWEVWLPLATEMRFHGSEFEKFEFVVSRRTVWAIYRLSMPFRYRYTTFSLYNGNPYLGDKFWGFSAPICPQMGRGQPNLHRHILPPQHVIWYANRPYVMLSLVCARDCESPKNKIK